MSEEEISDLVELMNAFTSSRFAQQAADELKRQRAIATNNRPERDTETAMGRKGHFGDAIPTPDAKDPARIGGRPIGK